jgi:hypothetical protein
VIRRARVLVATVLAVGWGKVAESLVIIDRSR